MTRLKTTVFRPEANENAGSMQGISRILGACTSMALPRVDRGSNRESLACKVCASNVQITCTFNMQILCSSMCTKLRNIVREQELHINVQ
jgi:hypothetical protein